MTKNINAETRMNSTDWEVDERPVLITGGAGFIGSNVADALLTLGQDVIVFDNLSRPGVEKNQEWLLNRHGSKVSAVNGDIRDPRTVREQVARASRIFHFAAQVAVTTSLVDPVLDFEINARGTFNLLEAMRSLESPPPLLFTSTNKVYGGLDDVPLSLNDGRYEPDDTKLRKCGVSEDRCLDFHSPYGCSKGTADQYVLDSVRSYGFEAVVFRMSCIYGPRQFGTEDQGWVAHFLIQALKNEPITLYGDGCQVRDILYVDDLVRAMLAAQSQIKNLSGHCFNIGGGPSNSISLLELLNYIDRLNGRRPEIEHEDWRIGDQRYYVSDTSKFEIKTGWKPMVCANEGIARLNKWLVENDISSITTSSLLSAAGGIR